MSTFITHCAPCIITLANINMPVPISSRRGFASFCQIASNMSFFFTSLKSMKPTLCSRLQDRDLKRYEDIGTAFLSLEYISLESTRREYRRIAIYNRDDFFCECMDTERLQLLIISQLRVVS